MSTTSTEVIDFRCEHCGYRIKVEPALAGRAGKCAGCGWRVVVPLVPAAATMSVAPPPPRGPTPTPRVEYRLARSPVALAIGGCGAAAAAYFALAFDTAPEGVHNVGLLNDRLIGVVVGGLVALAGWLPSRVVVASTPDEATRAIGTTVAWVVFAVAAAVALLVANAKWL